MTGGTDQIAAPAAPQPAGNSGSGPATGSSSGPVTGSSSGPVAGSGGEPVAGSGPGTGAGDQAAGAAAGSPGGDGATGSGGTGPAAAWAKPIDANLAALRRFLRTVDAHLPGAAGFADAHAFLDRAEQRLQVSRRHAVVALAGTTGSGKSSIFNALAGMQLSSVGVRRPTTGVAHACVWGVEGSGALLDWLAVPPNRRFEQPAGDGSAQLDGLVLLDLPDVDSMEQPHRAEVDRLIDRVDLVIWVLDPQKYADEVVHNRYLRPAAGRADVTVVVLNQVDTLGSADTARCVADLRHLLDADGLPGVHLVATSTVETTGLDELRALLAGTASGGDACVRRLWVDLCDTVEQLAPVVAVEPADDVVDRATVRLLIDILAEVSGVPSMVESFERGYREQATALTGWPVAAGARWLAGRLLRLRPDPLELRSAAAEATAARAASAAGDGDAAGAAGVGGAGGELAGVDAGPDLAAAQRAAAEIAARELVASAAGRLPQVWRDAAHAAALGRRRDLPAALDAAIAGTGPGLSRQPRWWHTVRLVHRVAAAAAVAGLAWLLVAAVTGAGAQVPPAAGVLVGALAIGALLAAGLHPAVRYLAGRGRRRAELRLRAAVAEVASDLVVAPARAVLAGYQDARRELHGAYPGSSKTLDELGRD